MTGYIGTTVNGTPITASGLIAGAHLVGIGSLKQYLDSGGAIIPRDGNNVPVTQYIAQFGGYALASVAPTYAEVLAANATGSAGPPGQSVPPSGSPSSPMFPSAPIFSNPEVAYAAGSGYSMAEFAEFFRLAVGGTLFLWVAYSFVEAYLGYAAGRRTPMFVGKTQLRVLVVMLMLLALLR